MSWKTRMNGVKRPRALNLSDPDHCRDWLRDLKFGPDKKKITKFQIKKDPDVFVTVDTASDSQIVAIAQGLATNLYKKPGQATQLKKRA